VNADRSPLFCDTALAERIERVEAQLIAKASEAARRRRADTAGFVIPVAGGVASFAEEGAPLNKVAGLGFAGVPSAAALDEIERAFTACGAPVQIELAHLADPAIGALLTDRGYRLTSFENVLGLPSTASLSESRRPGSRSGRAATTSSRARSSRELCTISRRGPASCATSHCATGSSPAAPASASQRASRSSPAQRPRPHRRRGVQTALLSARLAGAAAAGCDIAVITTQPASKSQQNAQRRGFDLLYTRAVLVKQP